MIRCLKVLVRIDALDRTNDLIGVPDSVMCAVSAARPRAEPVRGSPPSAAHLKPSSEDARGREGSARNVTVPSVEGRAPPSALAGIGAEVRLAKPHGEQHFYGYSVLS